MRTRLLIALLALCLPTFAGSKTWVVSPNACPQVDFSDVQSAVDAAAEGDTILIRSSGIDTGSIEIVQKSLTLIGDRLFTYAEDPIILQVTVRDLLPGQSVTIKGLLITEGFDLTNNQGPVWIEESSIEIPPGAVTPLQVILVEDCVSVTLTRCSWFQEGIGSFFADYGGGQIGLNAIRSEVHVLDCNGNGAFGVVGKSPTNPQTHGLVGGPALRVEESTINLSSTALVGGDGGPGFRSLTECGSGGDGGPAIFVSDLLSLVRSFESTTQGGAGGPMFDTSPPDPIPCSDGADAIDIDGPGSGLVVPVAGSARSVRFEENGILTEGNPANLVLEGTPGDLIFWGVGVAQDHAYLVDFNGSSVLTPLKVFTLGSIPPSGKKTLTLSIGDLTIPGEAITIFTQGYFFDLGLTPYISSPVAAVIIDSSSDPVDGCATVFYVDDDAAGDPGPGDPDISDPLEDGTLLRPFDAIQEAVDSVFLAGTIVQLADGLYVGTGNAEVNPPDTIHVKIVSENGPENCFIFASGSDSAFVFDNPTDVRADGLRGVRITAAMNRAVRTAESSVTIEDCIIEGNSGGNGAGIFVSKGSPLIQNCFIRSNFASVKGGGIYATNSVPVIRNCQLTNNAALDSGGGISVGGFQGTVIANCTVANNVGGGVQFRSQLGEPGPLELENCIVWGNTFGNQVEFNFGDLEVFYGDIQGGLAGIVNIFSGSITTGPGFIDADPLFVNPAGFDYHLGLGSPCIDAGDPAFIPMVGELDVDGDARVQGAAVDLGSDEF